MRFMKRMAVVSLALVLPLCANAMSLSGTVKNSVTGTGLFGAKVSLAMAKDSTTTGPDGSWSLASLSPTSIGLRSGSSTAVSGHLSLQDGHLVLRFHGHDLLGHSLHGTSAALVPAAAMARSSANIVDTLFVSWKDSIRARYPLTSYSATGLQFALDTSSIKLDTGHFTDVRDGQTYKYTKIGSQTWMAQNLNYVVDSSWCPGGITSNCAIYGRQYQWAAAMGLSSKYDTAMWGGALPYQGICPSDWHVPSDAEWMTLIQYVDSAVAGTQLKASSLWVASPGSDAYGFSILPAGLRDYNGAFFDHTSFAYFWTSSEYGAVDARSWWFSYETVGVYHNNYTKFFNISLRCLHN